MSAELPTDTRVGLQVPTSFEQVPKLTRYQLREYRRSFRFLALAGIVVAIGAIVTGVVGYYRHSPTIAPILGSNTAFYGSLWGGGASGVIVLAAVFFGGDAIAGEFQNKTGYFLMGLPIRRTSVYLGKFAAAYLASVAMMGLYLTIVIANGVYYFGLQALPWQLGLSLLLALLYLGAVMGATFLFSSLFKTSAYGFVLTAVLFLFGFSLLQTLASDLAGIEPWMVISYASSTLGNVFGSGVLWTHGHASITAIPVGRGTITTTTYTAGIAEGVVIMLLYLVESFAAGLWLFGREEFT